MKRREIDELKTKPLGELEKLIKETREHLQVLQFDLARGKVKNVGEIRESKKLIARLLTFMKLAGKPISK